MFSTFFYLLSFKFFLIFFYHAYLLYAFLSCFFFLGSLCVGICMQAFQNGCSGKEKQPSNLLNQLYK